MNQGGSLKSILRTTSPAPSQSPVAGLSDVQLSTDAPIELTPIRGMAMRQTRKHGVDPYESVVDRERYSDVQDTLANWHQLRARRDWVA